MRPHGTTASTSFRVHFARTFHQHLDTRARAARHALSRARPVLIEACLYGASNPTLFLTHIFQVALSTISKDAPGSSIDALSGSEAIVATASPRGDMGTKPAGGKAVIEAEARHTGSVTTKVFLGLTLTVFISTPCTI